MGSPAGACQSGAGRAPGRNHAAKIAAPGYENECLRSRTRGSAGSIRAERVC